MCSQRQQQKIHNLNRLLIATLSCAGFAMDGIDSSDVLFTISLLLWVWLPECDVVEGKLFDMLSQKAPFKTPESVPVVRRL